jgi:hypothetical protein
MAKYNTFKNSDYTPIFDPLLNINYTRFLCFKKRNMHLCDKLFEKKFKPLKKEINNFHLKNHEYKINFLPQGLKNQVL